MPGGPHLKRSIPVLALSLLGAPLAACESSAPTDLPPVPVQHGGAGPAGAGCRALVAQLPAQVADQTSRSVAPEPAQQRAAAWGDPPIVLTCGVQRPSGFNRLSTCTTVNDIEWYIPEEQLEPDSAAGPVTMTTVNRTPRVEVSMPRDYWPPATTLADLSEPLAATSRRTGRCS